MRPISNVVDVTNYVMLGLGSPLHAFDLAEARGRRRIVVRRAAPGEELRTLDGTLRRLDPRDLVITDGERPVALAGIMGGLDTEVADDTTDVCSRPPTSSRSGSRRAPSGSACAPRARTGGRRASTHYLAEQAATLATELMVELAGARWVGRHRRPRGPARASR